MANVFKKEDIKAGHLLVVKDQKCADRKFNMTVIPCQGVRVPPFLTILLGAEVVGCEDGELACCGGGEHWPLSEFDEELISSCGRFRVMAVYGETAPKFLLDNDTRERELLWELDEEPSGAKKAMLCQPMAGKSDEEIVATRERAIAALEAKGYTVINTLFTDEWYAPEAMKKRGVEQILRREAEREAARREEQRKARLEQEVALLKKRLERLTEAVKGLGGDVSEPDILPPPLEARELWD